MQRRQVQRLFSRLFWLALLAGWATAAGCGEDVPVWERCSNDSDCATVGVRCCGSEGRCVDGKCEYFSDPEPCCNHPSGCNAYCGINVEISDCVAASDCAGYDASLCCGNRVDCVDGQCTTVNDDPACCEDQSCPPPCVPELTVPYCTEDEDCGASTPYCEPTTNLCVECTDHSHCGPNRSCQGNECVDGPENAPPPPILGFSTLAFQESQHKVYSRHALGEVFVTMTPSTDGSAHHFPGVLF